MNTLILIIKGFFIGIGKIIPGVSGSLIAITLGVYDKLLGIVSNFFKNMKENIAFLFPLVVGILLAIMSTSKLLMFLLNNYYIIVMFFFVGLIFGSIPSSIKKIHLTLNRNIIYGIISFSLIIGLYFIKVSNSNEIHDYNMISMFLIGIVDAATMVIPGVSGTAIMMLLGCYNTVLNMFSNIYLIENLKTSIPFFIGVGVGIIIISKILYFCFQKYNSQTNYAIIGFTLSSSILIITETFKINGTIMDYIIGIILLMIGFKIPYLLKNINIKS